jgi:FSR family fosmidomycin resistance protein-like MFS transporter
MAFAHGASDLYSGILPFVIFFDVSRAGLPAWYQGALAFAWYLTSSIAQPLVGAYSDRRGRWWFLPASVALTAVAVSATAATRSLPLLLGLVVLGGFGSAVMHPEAGRFSSLLGGSKRASAISIFQIGGQIGYGIGPLVAAVLLAHTGAASAIAMSVPGVLAALAVATVLPSITAQSRCSSRAPGCAISPALRSRSTCRTCWLRAASRSPPAVRSSPHS